jgi:GxxExxY protein
MGAVSGKSDLPREVEDLARLIIGAAIEVHRELGPGLLESVYEEALCHELRLQSIAFARQHEIEVLYKATSIRGQRLDLVVAGQIVVELKSVSQIHDIHKAQLLSYLRAGRFPLGLLINFNTKLLKEGLHRVINEREIPPSRSLEPSR